MSFVPLRRLALAAGVLLILSALLYFGFGERLIRAAYEGASFEYLNARFRFHRLQDPDQRTLAYYLALGRSTYWRFFWVMLAAFVVLLGSLAYRPTLFRDYFQAKAGPVNLALFRIVLFAVLLYTICTACLLRFSALPDALRVPPTGTGWVVGRLPISDGLALGAAAVLMGCCVTGLLGLFSRTSALLAAVLALYVLGIPNFFGKVNHGDHHLVWFAALLAVSPCGDALSLDALRAARRRARDGLTAPPEPARAYALPLRFAWLLIGVIYFFPGFWKFVFSGPDWALGDNVKHVLEARLFMYDGWTPLFRLDQYPLLYKAAGVGTLLFEMGFVFVIFLPRLRPAAAVGALLFHRATQAFLRISFASIQPFLLLLFDLDGGLRWIGKKLFPDALSLHYDPDNPAHRRRVALYQSVDLFKRVAYRPSGVAQLTVIHRETPRTGRAARRLLLPRLPLLWLTLPFARLSRRDAETPGPKQPARRHALRPIWIVGTMLVAVNVGCGAALVNSWPFSVFPTFAALAGPEMQSVEMVAVFEDRAVRLDHQAPRGTLDPVHFYGLVQHILAAPDPRTQQTLLAGLWQAAGAQDPRLADALALCFYEATYRITPEWTGPNPVARRLLFANTLRPGADAADPDVCADAAP